MTPGERERLTALCQRIAEEKNNQKLAELLQQLHSVLDVRSNQPSQSPIEDRAPSWAMCLGRGWPLGGGILASWTGASLPAMASVSPSGSFDLLASTPLGQRLSFVTTVTFRVGQRPGTMALSCDLTELLMKRQFWEPCSSL